MFIQQILTGCLAQSSYYIECNGEAAVIDPMRESAPYIGIAAKRGARIRYIFETHFHADFISGHLDLAEETHATIVFGPLARPAYSAYIGAHLETFHLGECWIRLLHTPGHTIESSCFLLYNEDGEETAVFTGDTLFVSDAGRPDLMSGNKSKEELASLLYDSLRNTILKLPDHVIVYPGHGAGSACGRQLGPAQYSTIGHEKISNYTLQEMSRDTFIRIMTSNLPVAPQYFFQSASINMMGPRNLTEILAESNQAMSVDEVKKEITSGARVLDTRSWQEFHKAFIPGALNIGLQGNFAPWAGTLLDNEQPLVLICHPGNELEAMTRLARVGFEQVRGYLAGGFDSWSNAGEQCDQIFVVPPDGIDDYMSSGLYQFVDVRRPGETAQGSLPGAVFRPLDEFPETLHTFESHQNYILYCRSGYRAMIGASLLKSTGIKSVMCIDGGYADMVIIPHAEAACGESY